MKTSNLRGIGLSLAVSALASFSCSETGVGDKPCKPGCVDEKTRIECASDGTPRTVPCEQPAEACAESVCKAGACKIQPAVDAPCGKDGNAKCNEAYVCLGPDLQLTAIRQHTCALTDDGKVWCWGEGSLGELGDGAKEDRGNPVLVQGLTGPAVMVTVGYVNACALMGNGEVYCWGDNTGGQTAPDSQDNPIPEPRLLTSPVAFTQIAGGQGHACGVTAEETVYCWGNSLVGQCGVDPANGFRVGPTQIPGLDHVKSIVTVKNHTCAIRSADPTMMCWGGNKYIDREAGAINVEKLGPGANGVDYSPTPVLVDLGKKIIAAGMSYESTYAVTEDGSVYGWGFNGTEPRQLGAGLTDVYVTTPTQVMTGPGEPLSGAVALARSDGSDMCAEVREDASHTHYVCWGENDVGELGAGVGAYEIVPYATKASALPPSASKLVRGEDHGCAVVTENEHVDVWCYGKGLYVANGSLDPNAAQAEPKPVQWDPSQIESLLENP